MWNFCQITMSNFGLIDVRIIVSEKEQSDARTHAHRTFECVCAIFLQLTVGKRTTCKKLFYCSDCFCF